MKKPVHLSEAIATLWDELAGQVRPNTPPAAMEALCRQMQLMRDCSRRIQAEGAVVMDAKGNAAEHPAIRIEREAGKQVRDWLSQYKRVGIP